MDTTQATGTPFHRATSWTNNASAKAINNNTIDANMRVTNEPGSLHPNPNLNPNPQWPNVAGVIEIETHKKERKKRTKKRTDIHNKADLKIRGERERENTVR